MYRAYHDDSQFHFPLSSINFFGKVSTSIGNSAGKPYSARIAWISVSCSPGFPNTFITFQGTIGLWWPIFYILKLLPLFSVSYSIFWNKNIGIHLWIGCRNKEILLNIYYSYKVRFISFDYFNNFTFRSFPFLRL
jgi:hypothetical protein